MHHGGPRGGRRCQLWHLADQFDQVPQRQLLTDAVDKVGDERLAGNNRIQVPSFLNLYCAPDSYLDSMLLTRPSKNVYRQHRPKADATRRPDHLGESVG